jgi:hypothetical protein
MRQQIEKKLEYYKKQVDVFTDRHLETCKRTDRDALMRCKERVKVYQEILKLIQ